MKKIQLIFVIFITLVSSGCFIKERDLSQMAFPISLGISYKNEKYQVYMQIINISTISKIEVESTKDNATFILMSEEADTITKAFEKLRLEALTVVSAIKLKSIVLHSSLFEECPLSFEEITQNFLNNPIFRTNVQLYTTSYDLEEFYGVKYYLIGTSIYSHINEDDPIITTGYVKPSILLNAMKAAIDLNRMYYFPKISLTENIADEGTSEGQNNPLKTYDYDGICFSTYSSKKLECITEEEAYAFRWYQELNYYSVDVNEETQPINLIINHVNWKNKISDNHFYISITVDAYINFNLTTLGIDKITKELNDLIKEEVTNGINLAYQKNFDIYHLNDYALRKKLPLKYNLENTIIDVKSTIKNTNYYKY